GGAVGVVAAGEPGPVGLEAGEPALAEEGLPLVEEVAAHLVEEDEHGELDAGPVGGRGGLGGPVGGGGDQPAEQGEQRDEDGAAHEQVREGQGGRKRRQVRDRSDGIKTAKMATFCRLTPLPPNRAEPTALE